MAYKKGKLMHLLGIVVIVIIALIILLIFTTEDIIISLMIFNLGCIFTIGLSQAKLSSDHRHLASQFRSLSNDFKRYAKK